MTRTKSDSRQAGRALRRYDALGYTLLELMITILIVAMLSRIAYATYIKSVTKSRRSAAEACLMNHADYMERYYATNQRYDQDTSGTAMTTALLQGLSLPCTSATTGTGSYYSYSFSVGPGQSTYTLQAAPTGSQLNNDAQCGALTLQQDGTKGSTGSAGGCWAK